MGSFDSLVEQNKAVRIFVQNIVEDVLEVVELKLEMAKVALYAFCELYFTQEGMKYPCSIAYSRHKASDLVEDGQVSN